MHKILQLIGEHPLPVMPLLRREVYVENLKFLAGLIVASEPMLEEVLRRDMPDALAEFYYHHLADERGHYALMLEDLRAMDAEPRELDWRAAQIAGPQYYIARHGPPQALLGYMAALECRPMPLTTVDRLERAHGLGVVRTMRLHAERDVEHSAELLAIIDTFPDEESIACNASLTASMLRWALSETAMKETA